MKRDEGLSLLAIAEKLNQEELADEAAPDEHEAPRKPSWYPMKVKRVLARLGYVDKRFTGPRPELETDQVVGPDLTPEGVTND